MNNEAIDTEAKIKEAARKVFLVEGYDGAKIRRIADEAGVNLAMVNYYFRSKEQLFMSIYKETFREFLGRLVQMLNEQTPLEVKIWKIVDRYTDFIVENPLVPVFLLSELRNENNTFFKELGIKSILEESYFRKQLLEESKKGTIRPIEPLHIILSIISNIVFPVMAKPMVSFIGGMDDAGFREFIKARKQIIPEMIMTYLRQV
ncbi:TetR/AcrR family transcriptional regulator [Spirosoma sp. SC4-14]|uniref:TetR/AcrR family transcriptional regulator n=1 Tax=Spirosoma sp. SC4-14 TaxID=3128900 RepID=UPI0030D4F7B0